MSSSRFALCVSVQGCCACMIYDDDLHSVEIRHPFDGARVGQWYCVCMEGTAEIKRKFEPVEAGVGEAKTVPKCKVNRSNRDIQIQLYLPIFFAPDLTKLGLKSSTVPFSTFYSPKFGKRSGEVQFELNSGQIQSGVIYEAFVSLQMETFLPEWTLKSIEHVSTNLRIDNKIDGHLNNGVVLMVIPMDGNNTDLLATLVCLEDEQLAFGRVAKDISAGDYVRFIASEVDCFAPSVKLVALDICKLTYTSATPLRKVIEAGKNLFELVFSFDDTIGNINGGMIRTQMSGDLLDPDGKVKSALANYLRHDSAPIEIAVRANFCALPERQTPLWYFVELVRIGNPPAVNSVVQNAKLREEVAQDEDDIDEDFRLGADQSSIVDEQEENSLNDQQEVEVPPNNYSDWGDSPATTEYSVENTSTSVKWNRLEDGSHRMEVERREEFNVPDGGFGHTRFAHRFGNTQRYESTRELAEPLKVVIMQTKINEEAKKTIVLFIEKQNSEWLLFFFDDQQRKFTHWCCTQIKNLPIPPGLKSPAPGSWFGIRYTFDEDAHSEIRRQKHIRVWEMQEQPEEGNLPVWVNPNNSEVWAQALEGNFERLLLAKRDKSVPPQPLKTAPVPATNVFSRKPKSNAVAMPRDVQKENIEQRECEDAIKKEKNGVEAEGELRLASDADLCFTPSPVPSNASSETKRKIVSRGEQLQKERFFNVELEMAGILVGSGGEDTGQSQGHTYRVWPFCTGSVHPRELRLDSEKALKLGMWVKFPKMFYELSVDCPGRGVIERFEELSPWLKTVVRNGEDGVPRVYLNCQFAIPNNFDDNAKSEIWTCRYKPKQPSIPFIRRIMTAKDLLPTLCALSGQSARGLLQYERGVDKHEEVVGLWRIVQLP